MAQDKADKAVKALENTIKELSGLDELTSGIKSLENTIVDSNEELIATFVEGTKRLIKKPNQDVSPLLRKLDETTSTKLDSLKSGVGEVERAVKSLKFPSSADFRSPAAILKLPIKELTRAVNSFELPKEAKDAIPVRLSDGDKFYKALDGIVQQISGGGATSYAFHNSSKTPGKALIDADDHLQVDVLSMPAVSIDTTGLATAAKQDDIITAIGAIPGGGTQYTEGDVDTSITGNAMMMEVASNTLQPVQGTVADGLLVNLGANNDVTVTGSVTANAGTNLNTSALALESGGNLAAIKAKTDNIPALGQALAAASVPVVLTAAQLTTLTPLATVAVTQSGTWDEVGVNDSGNSLTVDAPVGTPVFVRLSDGASAITTLPVSLATVPSHAVTNAGTFVVQENGAALTALQLIDNLAVAVDGNYLNVNMNVAGTDVVSGSGTATGALRVELPTNGTGVIATVGAVTAITNALPAGTNAIGKLAANSGVDIGDVDVTSLPALAAGTNAIGKLIPPDYDTTSHTANADKYYTNAGAVTDGIIWSPAAGKRWHVTLLYINVSAAATVTIEDDLAGGDVVRWKGELAANSGVVLPYGDLYPMTSGEDAADLIITTSAGNVYVQAKGYEI